MIKNQNEIYNFNLWEDSNCTIQNLFEEASKKTPDKLAIVDNDYSISFRELSDLTDVMASFLLERGAKTGKPIGVYLKKSHLYIISCIAILKAGCAYIHIDSEYSEEIINTIFEDINPDLIITSSTMQRIKHAQNSKSIFLDIDTEWDKPRTGILTKRQVSAEEVAIIGYTSGTTGKPKGVEVSHRAAIYAFCKFWNEVKDIKENDRFGYVTYLAWDAMSPLLFNATGVIVPDQASTDLDDLLGYFKVHNINHAFFTPSLLKNILNKYSLEDLNEHFSKLKIIWLGGEIIERELLEKLNTLLPEVSVFNNYGPTECFVVSQGPISINNILSDGKVPAGYVLPEIDYLLFDDYSNDVTMSGQGYLYVSGPALANCYVNRPELTQEKFLKINNRIYYKTEDCCRILDDRQIIVLARQSFMINNDGKILFLKDVEQEFKFLINPEDCVAVKSKVSNNESEINLFYVLSSDKDRNIVNTIIIDKFKHVICTEVSSIPIHPVSAKIDYAKLLRIKNNN